MPRKIMTEADKRAYERKVSGKVSLYTRYRSLRKIKRIIYTVLAAACAALIIAGIVWLNIRPMRVSDVIGHGFANVEWSDNTAVTAEEIKKWKVEKIYPGSLGDNAGIECIFYDKKGERIGSITFPGHDNYMIYENGIYRYTEPED